MWIAAYPAIHYATQNERIIFVISAFILFRFFDILKPFPISYLDKNVKGGLGIVLDDVVAGVFAAAITIILMTLVFS
jgi:phosphatidylglycerophosphatase A